MIPDRWTNIMNYKDFYRKKCREYGMEELVWVQGRGEEFMFISPKCNVRYKRTGEGFRVTEDFILNQYVVFEVTFLE